jgi:hypothetical protein
MRVGHRVASGTTGRWAARLDDDARAQRTETLAAMRREQTVAALSPRTIGRAKMATLHDTANAGRMAVIAATAL